MVSLFGEGSFFPGLLLEKVESISILNSELSPFDYIFQSGIFSDVIELLSRAEIMANSISLEFNWDLFLFSTVKRDTASPGSELMGYLKAGLKYFYSDNRQVCLDGKEVEPMFSWSGECSSCNCTAFPPATSSAPQGSLTHVLL